eukprot:SAG11_NODE_2169_length_3724_cov_2.236966_1_plen_235_part_00
MAATASSDTCRTCRGSRHRGRGAAARHRVEARPAARRCRPRQPRLPPPRAALTGDARSPETGDHGASNIGAADSIAAAEGILAFCGDQLGSGGTSAEQQKAQHDVIGSTWLQMRGFEHKVGGRAFREEWGGGRAGAGAAAGAAGAAAAAAGKVGGGGAGAGAGAAATAAAAARAAAATSAAEENEDKRRGDAVALRGLLSACSRWCWLAPQRVSRLTKHRGITQGRAASQGGAA